MTTLIRHRNRGDIDAGGCGVCKPRHKREDDIMPVDFMVDEGLTDYMKDHAPDGSHVPVDSWTFGV